MSKDKAVIFLVEGNTEIRALNGPLEILFECNQYYKKNCQVFFGLLDTGGDRRQGGDITTELGVDVHNIEEKINDWMVCRVLDKYKLRLDDLMEIIQFVDLDGAYLTGDNIIKPENGGKRVRYKDGKIFAPDPARIIERNSRKSLNLDYLQSIATIPVTFTEKGAEAISTGEEMKLSDKSNVKNNALSAGNRTKRIPYSIYYFSSNLDHYIHHNANLKDKRKIDMAKAFCSDCMQNMKFFIETFTTDTDSICDRTYEKSWKFIREGSNSVSRHTNVGILINSIRSRD